MKKQTLGAKNRNPLNIRYNVRNKWLGQRGQNSGFCVFSTMQLGFRAAYLLLCRYHREGLETIESIIKRWAPPSENDCESYIKFVCDETQIPRNARIGNDAVLLSVLRAMGIFESGVDLDNIMCARDIPRKYNIHI